MRQLDLFGFDSEPQSVAPAQKKKAVTVVPAPAPVTASAPDSNTLVFADDKIGIKIKLKHEVSVVADTTPSTTVPKMGDTEPDLENENAAGLLQQLTLEEAIREVSNDENDLVNYAIATPEPVVSEAPVTAVAAEEASVGEGYVVSGVEEISVDEGAVVSGVENVSITEDVVSGGDDDASVTDDTEVAGIEEAAATTQEVAVQADGVHETDVIEDEPAIVKEHTVAEETVSNTEDILAVEATHASAAADTLPKVVKPVVLSRPFLTKPTIIEISDAPEETPVAELQQNHPDVEEVPVAVQESAHSIVNESTVVTPEPNLAAVEEVPVTVQESAPPVEEETHTVTQEVGHAVVEEETAAANEDVAVAEENIVTPEEVALTEATLPPSVESPSANTPELTQDKTAVAADTQPPVPEVPSTAIVSQEAPVPAGPLVAKAKEMPAPESLSAIVEEVAARQQQPAKIKAPKLHASREPVAPKKRGRKSFKEIDAESDLIQLPDDEALFEKQYYPISVVAGWFNVNASLLRFWENEFDILKPRKNRKGDRLFRPEDVKNLQVIYYLLRQRKFTIEGAKEYLKTNKKKADTNTQLIQSLNKLRGFLLEFKSNMHA